MKPINQFLLDNDLRIADNPCVSPDFCLDWEGLQADLAAGADIVHHDKSRVATSHGEWSLVENRHGDHAWRLSPADATASGPEELMEDGSSIEGQVYFPASYENLIRAKNLFQEADSNCSIFPVAGADLGRSTLGIGARFTTLHWDGVDWAMSRLGKGLTANQNSIPRELVYDVDEMLADRLDSVPFPFIGCDVPEGHQGQSVEGMSHGCALAKLKSGRFGVGSSKSVSGGSNAWAITKERSQSGFPILCGDPHLKNLQLTDLLRVTTRESSRRPLKLKQLACCGSCNGTWHLPWGPAFRSKKAHMMRNGHPDLQ